MRIERNFFTGAPMQVAQDLIGAYLCKKLDNGKILRTKICELELYTEDERGCHAYNKKKTNRNDAMFMQGGITYVYLCYGLHNMLNIVIGPSDFAAAVLIRATEHPECTGPAKLTKFLDITRDDNKTDLCDKNSNLWLEYADEKPNIKTSTRIGIDFAMDDAKLPWRFVIADSKFLSRPI